ncbi:FAD-dependent oxidoreductase [Methanobacterium sp.]|uniref:FAD-dependent oxidoreductase n=1 Tax=Methanobacterium sp. TaxID=2164 RepID=UPI003C76CDDE
MSNEIPGKAESFWIDTTPGTNFSRLENGLKVDVAVLGGGIAGLTTAIMLKESGKSVAVIESRRIVEDITATTTAKISAHAFFYSTMLDNLGKEKTQMFAEANLRAVESVSNLVSKYNIDCDFRRTPCYIYTEAEEEAGIYKSEAKVASELGLPVSYTEDIPFSSEVKAGVIYQNQAEFHPRKYLLGLSKEISGKGSYIFENTRVLEIKEENPYEIITDQGPLIADNVVVATHTPVYDPDSLYAYLTVRRSYIMMYYAKESFPEGMFVCLNPFHTYRSIPGEKGKMIMIAGEHQIVGTPIDTRECYKRLEKYTADNWDIESIEYHWSNQDDTAPDGFPIIGETSKPGVYVATAFGGWGMTHATTAAFLITDIITGKENHLSELFNPLRFKDSKLVVSRDDEKLETAKKFQKGEIQWHSNLEIPELSRDEARVIGDGKEKFSVYLDKDGHMHRLQAVCNHRGCTLTWNTAEKTWDCPCHGSRYNYEGQVIHAPALLDLKNYSEK